MKSKSLHFPPTSPSGSDSTSRINHRSNDDDEEEDGLIKNSSEIYHPRNTLPGSNGLTMNLLEETTNPNLMQLRLAQMMASAVNSSSPGQQLNDNHSMMNALANMQRSMMLQILSDPMAAAQAAAAAAAAMSSTQIKATNLTPLSSNNKQMGSGRKRKSTPEKRPITNNNGNVRIFSLTYFFVMFRFRHLQSMNTNHLRIIIMIQSIIHWN